MNTESPRRTFLKHSTVLGGGLLLLGSNAGPSRAAESKTEPAGGAALPTNDPLAMAGVTLI